MIDPIGIALSVTGALLIVATAVGVFGYGLFLLMGPMVDGDSDGYANRWDNDKYSGLNNTVYLAGRRHGTKIRKRAEMRRALRRSERNR